MAQVFLSYLPHHHRCKPLYTKGLVYESCPRIELLYAPPAQCSHHENRNLGNTLNINVDCVRFAI